MLYIIQMGYKEKKKKIEELGHEVKLNKAQCAKYKSDNDKYKSRCEQLEAELQSMRQIEQSLRSSISSVPSTLRLADGELEREKRLFV